MEIIFTCSFRITPWSRGEFFLAISNYQRVSWSWEHLGTFASGTLHPPHLGKCGARPDHTHQLQGSIQPVMAQRTTPLLLWKCNPYFAGRVLWGTRLPPDYLCNPLQQTSQIIDCSGSGWWPSSVEDLSSSHFLGIPAFPRSLPCPSHHRFKNSWHMLPPKLSNYPKFISPRYLRDIREISPCPHEKPPSTGAMAGLGGQQGS